MNKETIEEIRALLEKAKQNLDDAPHIGNRYMICLRDNLRDIEALLKPCEPGKDTGCCGSGFGNQNTLYGEDDEPESQEPIREQLADLCHKQWSGWMKYLFDKCVLYTPDKVQAENGAMIIPKWACDRWLRQSVTPYEHLTAEEQDSDRAEADKFIALLKPESQEPAEMTNAGYKECWLIHPIDDVDCHQCPKLAECQKYRLNQEPAPDGHIKCSGCGYWKLADGGCCCEKERNAQLELQLDQEKRINNELCEPANGWRVPWPETDSMESQKPTPNKFVDKCLQEMQDVRTAHNAIQITRLRKIIIKACDSLEVSDKDVAMGIRMHKRAMIDLEAETKRADAAEAKCVTCPAFIEKDQLQAVNKALALKLESEKKATDM